MLIGMSNTQGALVMAVTRHPDKPRSIEGECLPDLLTMCEEHSLLQARLQRQGHHNWNTRFQALLKKYGGTPTEVCAESWEWERDDLDLAADSCVKSWRQSSGHWKAVSSPCKSFGYDMKQGKNGIWYATGIFIQ